MLFVIVSEIDKMTSKVCSKRVGKVKNCFSESYSKLAKNTRPVVEVNKSTAQLMDKFRSLRMVNGEGSDELKSLMVDNKASS